MHTRDSLAHGCLPFPSSRKPIVARQGEKSASHAKLPAHSASPDDNQQFDLNTGKAYQ